MFENYPDIVNVSTLTEMLDIGSTSAYSLLQSGQIRAFKQGRCWKISKKAVEEYVLHNTGVKDINVFKSN
jgi:excisionase family DNA binding protein